MFMLLPFWWVFTVPGRLRIWVNYMFPKNVDQAFASDRQRDSSVVLIMYSMQFWIKWLTLSFLMAGFTLLILRCSLQTCDQQQITVPVAVTNFYLNLHSFWLARLSEWCIIHMLHTVYEAWLYMKTFHGAAGILPSANN